MVAHEFIVKDKKKILKYKLIFNKKYCEIITLPAPSLFNIPSGMYCGVVGAIYANGWLNIVGASKTSPVPGNGIRRRHARRRILPRFGALRGDNTPSPALRGLHMITRSTQVATSAP